jgi:hypothetical protein
MRIEAVKPAGEQRRLADTAAGRGDWQRWRRYDVIRHDTERVPLKIYSMVGLVPLFAAIVVEPRRSHSCRL